MRPQPEAVPLSTASEILNHASAAFPAADAQGKALREIQLLPMGTFKGRDGRGPWVLRDRAHAERVIAATRALIEPQQMMGDYDHQAVYAIGPDKGGRAEASGWIDAGSLNVRDDGIWAVVEWTQAAADKLADRAYRYISPFFGSAAGTGEVTRIFNFGLVNQPAIRELAAAASSDFKPGNPESMKTILTALGLKDDATEADACAAITALQGAGQAAEQLAAAATALGLDASATGEAVVAAATQAAANRPDPSKFVPVETFQSVSDQLKVINEERAAAAVDAAISTGKIVPANRDWALGYFAQDEKAFTAFVAAQAPVLTPGAKTPGGQPPKGADGMTDEDREVCTALGIDPAAFAETRKKEQAQ